MQETLWLFYCPHARLHPSKATGSAGSIGQVEDVQEHEGLGAGTLELGRTRLPGRNGVDPDIEYQVGKVEGKVRRNTRPGKSCLEQFGYVAKHPLSQNAEFFEHVCD